MKRKFCIIVANYYPKISRDLILGAVKILKLKNIRNYNVIKVPGVFEIPFVISKYINRYDGFISLGCVIKGETPHFEFICSSTINAIMHLSVSFKKPIGNGIITCLNKKQALNRSDPKKKNKGREAANAVLSVLKA